MSGETTLLVALLLVALVAFGYIISQCRVRDEVLRPSERTFAPEEIEWRRLMTVTPIYLRECWIAAAIGGDEQLLERIRKISDEIVETLSRRDFTTHSAVRYMQSMERSILLLRAGLGIGVSPEKSDESGRIEAAWAVAPNSPPVPRFVDFDAANAMKDWSDRFGRGGMTTWY